MSQALLTSTHAFVYTCLYSCIDTPVHAAIIPLSLLYELTLIICKSSLAVKVILKESNVGLGRVFTREELFVCGFVERRSLNILDYPLDSRHNCAIILDVLRKVDFWNYRRGLLWTRTPSDAGMLGQLYLALDRLYTCCPAAAAAAVLWPFCGIALRVRRDPAASAQAHSCSSTDLLLDLRNSSSLPRGSRCCVLHAANPQSTASALALYDVVCPA